MSFSLLVTLLGACGGKPSPADDSAADERAVAQVEAIQKQKPPPRMIAPDPILFADMEKHDLFGAGCAFAPGNSMGAVLLARENAAYMKIANKLVRLASDPGSGKMPMGTWSRYTGRDMAVALTKVADAGDDHGNDSVRWPGHLTVTDASGQLVYNREGLVQCGA